MTKTASAALAALTLTAGLLAVPAGASAKEGPKYHKYHGHFYHHYYKFYRHDGCWRWTRKFGWINICIPYEY